jgi:hypothetical protein
LKPRTPVLNICYRVLKQGHRSNAVFRISETIIVTTIVKSLSLEYPTEFQIELPRLFAALLTFTASDLYRLTVLGILDNGSRKIFYHYISSVQFTVLENPCGMWDYEDG